MTYGISGDPNWSEASYGINEGLGVIRQRYYASCLGAYKLLALGTWVAMFVCLKSRMRRGGKGKCNTESVRRIAAGPVTSNNLSKPDWEYSHSQNKPTILLLALNQSFGIPFQEKNHFLADVPCMRTWHLYLSCLLWEREYLEALPNTPVNGDFTRPVDSRRPAAPPCGNPSKYSTGHVWALSVFEFSIFWDSLKSLKSFMYLISVT